MSSFRSILLVFTVLFVVYSCNKEDTKPVEQVLTINDINNITLEIEEIKTSAVRVNVLYDNPTNIRGFVQVGTFFRLQDATVSSFQEASTGWIEGLERGRKYVVKGYVEIEGQRKETESLIFTTPSFYAERMVGAIGAFHKREYKIWSIGFETELESAPEISGFLKVGSDSLALESVVVDADYFMTVTLPKNTQYFFENDDEFILKKEFSIGLFSGEYYTEITESEFGATGFNYVENTPHFTVYNKTPFIDGFTVFPNLFSCEEDTTVRVNIEGGFGAIRESFFYPNTEMEYEEISITISKLVEGSTEILSYITMDNQRPSNNACALDQFVAVEDLGASFQSMQHPTSTILLRLDRELYQNGAYQVQFSGTDVDSNEWTSNTIDFTIDIQ